jgi:hypothetical protein
VLAVEPPILLEFERGPDTLRFELRAEGASTRLVLTALLEALSKAARDGAGWHVCLEQLSLGLDGSATDVDTSKRWRTVHPDSVESFGPSASVDGPPREWEDVYGAA